MKITVTTPSGPLQKLAGLMQSPRGIAAGLVLITLIIYWPVLDNEFVLYDDPGYVTENLVVRRGLTFAGFLWAFQNINLANWHPVTWLSHMLDCTLFGMNPAGHHAVNVLGHAANAVLLFYLWFRMTGARWRSALVAALFAWHPLHVESVAWVAERKDILSTGFGLLALLYYHRYATDRRRAGYWIALGMFALSLMSKPMLVTLPFVMLLLDYWPLERLAWDWNRRPVGSPAADVPMVRSGSVSLRAAVIEKLPFFALTLACSVVTLWAQRHGGAVASVETLPFRVRLVNVVVSYAGYLGQMLWPKDLIVLYMYDFNQPTVHLWVALFILVGITALVVLLPGRKYLLVGWCLYLGTLVPVIGLVHAGQQAHADRYTYVPLIGIFVMLAWGSREIFSRLPRPQPAAAVCWGLVLFAGCPLTWRQAQRWKNSETLFSFALAREPMNSVALGQMVDVSLRAGDPKKAVHYLQKYSEVCGVSELTTLFVSRTLNDLNRPQEGIAVIEEYVARTNVMTGRLRIALGEIAHSAGDKARAYAEYRKAQEFKDARFPATMRLAGIRAEDRALPEAEADYRKALAEDPRNPAARLGLAGVLSDQGRTDEAQELLRQAMAFPPFTVAEFAQVAAVQGKLGMRSEAEANYLRATEMDRWNYDVHFNLGNLYARNGVFTNAIRYLGRAAELRPNFPDARNNLAVALASIGQFHAASTQYREAIRLAPGQPDAYYGLARSLEMQTNFFGAAAQYTKAIQLKPDFHDARVGLALVLNQDGKWSNAVPHWELVLKANPASGIAQYQLGVALLKLKRTPEALPHLERAVTLRPRDSVPIDTLARVLATASDATLRNGARAVALSEPLCQPREQAAAARLETLAAAYAETGAFDQARALAALAVEAAVKAGDEALAVRVRQHLALYQAGRPLRDTP